MCRQEKDVKTVVFKYATVVAGNRLSAWSTNGTAPGWANGIALILGSYSDSRNAIRFNHPRIPAALAVGVSNITTARQDMTSYN